MAGLFSFIRFLIMVMFIGSILLMHPSQIHAGSDRDSETVFEI